MSDLPRLTLILGGARSGKSRHAEALIAQAERGCTYIATAQALDSEMRRRIAEHRARRPAHWATIEAPIDLPAALSGHAPGCVVLVDCLTLWLSNILLAERDIAADSDALVAALQACEATVICVSNEVGLGIVPDNALARAFRDAQGQLNQRIAALADRVVLMTAGQPTVVKDTSLPSVSSPRPAVVAAPNPRKPPRHQNTKVESPTAIPSSLDSIARDVVDCAFKVHSTLGPGLLESVYEACLALELESRGHGVARQVPVPIVYEGMSLSGAFRIDLLVDNALVVEVKAAEQPNPLFDAQLLTYLKLTGRRLGLVINFDVPLIKDGIRRLAR
ncbi:MAG: bifunctional adenosylcobinamide kinase/adenosylcobinamide-phosphate guanylyltransferase [Alphaproteobacteria bacterium]|nr:bifunctional adenosylcobinamide kinase/adenosylcobinamide-phosphate guanylyltransferase [Alphaproteobacteria bacterium]